MTYALAFLSIGCPDVCGLVADVLRRSLLELRRSADGVAIVAVSLDPHVDQPEAVRRWLQAKQMPRNFYFGIGAEAELRPIWEQLGAAPRLAGRPETSPHAGTVWLVDSRGAIRTSHALLNGTLREMNITRDLRTLLAEQD